MCLASWEENYNDDLFNCLLYTRQCSARLLPIATLNHYPSSAI